MTKAKPLYWYEPLTPLSFLSRIDYVMPDKVAVIHGDRFWTWADTIDFGRHLYFVC